MCSAGFYQRYADSLNSTTFTCTICPEGALCSGDATPLAREGFWHAPNDRTEFFDCEESEWCLAEETSTEMPVNSSAHRRSLFQSGNETNVTTVANCRPGHMGVVCGTCMEGWTKIGTTCGECPPNSAFTEWPRAKLGGIVAMAVILFVGVSLPFLLSGLLFPKKTHEASFEPAAVTGPLHAQDGGKAVEIVTVHDTHVPGKSSLRALAKEHAQKIKTFVKFCDVPARLVLETLQIISSFKKTMRLSWPSIYVVLMRRLSFLNLNLLTLPGTACSTPRSDFYNSFNGITISVAGMLIYIALVWYYGMQRMHRLRWAQTKVDAFHRKTLHRLVLFLTISYAPVTEVVLSMYSCRNISGKLYLREDTSKMCLYHQYATYRHLAGFWVAFYVFGVPLLFLGLLFYYNVPQVARALQANQRLRSLWMHAHHKGIALPEVQLQSITLESIAHDHIRLLFRALIGKSGHGGEIGDSNTCMQRCFQVSEPASDEQLRQLMTYAARQLHHTPVTWHEAANDPRMKGAHQAIGMLYKEFYAGCWYWILVEQCNKLIITGVLGFIAPGTNGQVAAGMLMTFVMLLIYQGALPYSDKVYRHIGYGAAIQLFLFLVFALLLSADIKITGGGVRADRLFYGACLGILTSSVFVLPVLLVLYRLLTSDQLGEEEE